MSVGMGRDLIVIGGSAGALEPLRQIAADLPADLPASVMVVLHLSSTAKSALAPILNRSGGLRTATPRDGDPIQPGYLYVPVPDHHLEVAGERITLTRGPKVNGVRPAVDVLFRSAAKALGPRVIGVVLSGGLDDGGAGLLAIKAAGGIAIVQSPEEAFVDSMPRNAIKLAAPDHVLPAQEIAAVIKRVIGKPAPARPTAAKKGGVEMEVVGAQDAPGQVTGITCPDCHGSIWLQVGEDGEIAFACRIGHSYAPESFFEIQAGNVENALWAGVRSLEEQAALADAMAARSQKLDDARSVERYETRKRIAKDNAESLRRLILEKSDEVA